MRCFKFFYLHPVLDLPPFVHAEQFLYLNRGIIDVAKILLRRFILRVSW